MNKSQLLWPVYGFNEWGQTEDIAIFFDWAESVQFIQHPELYSAEKRNYYQAQTRTLGEMQDATAT